MLSNGAAFKTQSRRSRTQYLKTSESQNRLYWRDANDNRKQLIAQAYKQEYTASKLTFYLSFHLFIYYYILVCQQSVLFLKSVHVHKN